MFRSESRARDVFRKKRSNWPLRHIPWNGGAFFVVRNVDAAQLLGLAAKANIHLLLLAFLGYLTTLFIRAVRWSLLLSTIHHQKFRDILEATVAGFAANYLLPARLGELVRADYLMRTGSWSRFSVLGSIGIERTLDGITVVGLLGLSILILSAQNKIDAATVNIVMLVLFAGTMIFALLAAIVVLSRLLHSRLVGSKNSLVRRIELFVAGLLTLTSRNALPVLLLTLLIWSGELGVLTLTVGAFGVHFALLQFVLLGATATLSTLVPTAPGFLGSLQFVFGLLFEAFGDSRATGIAAATAMQLCCYFPIAVIGIVVGVVRWSSVARNSWQRAVSPADSIQR